MKCTCNKTNNVEGNCDGSHSKGYYNLINTETGVVQESNVLLDSNTVKENNWAYSVNTSPMKWVQQLNG